jgi:hypothetical protein
MNTFSNLLIFITCLIGFIVVMPPGNPSPQTQFEESDEADEADSPFVKKSICDLRTQYTANLRACGRKNRACREEWQAKLDILNEEER